jgi:hypothetical protein
MAQCPTVIAPYIFTRLRGITMNWSTPGDLRAQVMRLWDRGVLTRAQFAPEPGLTFPIRLRLVTPTIRELSAHFELVRAWISALQAITTLRIEWREAQHRVLGTQRVPDFIWLDDFASAIQLINKREQGEQLREIIAQTEAALPSLLPWLWLHSPRAIALAAHWPKLLAVVQWRLAHPVPGIYLRQVDIPGVHSKFIESHRAVLGVFLEQVLGNTESAIAPEASQSFATRFGFLERPTRIRFRALDARFALIANTDQADLKLDADNFAKLDFSRYPVPLKHVFITENEINFLAFPNVENALVIFGAGYGWDALAKARWLHRCHLHYWGDLDTHGFAILHQLRLHFPRTQSLLMDQATLMQHESIWGEEPKQFKGDLTRLSAPENAVYNLLRDNVLRPNLRLEQEHIGFRWVQQALRVVSEPAPL